MAKSDQEKSRGLKFAEQQMLRHGWEQGKGLGRNENGISEAIKVKVKCDKGGVGHREGEAFTFQWWDHVFNKASSSLEVESDPNGVKMKKLVEDQEEGMISNKKPIKSTLAMQDKLYGSFVKSATLLSGNKETEPSHSSPDEPSSSDDESQQDLSSTTKLSDADLIKACGGLTAHKGARHGLTMKAKLARLEQQEQEFMAKYSKKSQPAVPLLDSVNPTTQPAPQIPEGEEQTGEESLNKKFKKKRIFPNVSEIVTDGSADVDIRPKKRKSNKSSKEGDSEKSVTAGLVVEGAAQAQPDEAQHKKKKHKKRKSNRDVSGEENESALGKEEASLELCTDICIKKKKKKKKHPSTATWSAQEDQTTS
ncbi:G patch domain-containing protein 4 [Aplochiton taeniatus]